MNDATNDDKALEMLLTISREVVRYGGKLQSFADSWDYPDQACAEGMRRMSRELAEVVFADEELSGRAHLALAWACRDDSYATKEVAGRFLSATRRLRVAAKIQRHPRAARFVTLVAAIKGKNFTKKQWALAQEIAAEVG